MDSGFELHGTEDHETRSVVHRATGFSVVIPGHPVARASETRAFELVLTDAEIEVMLRMDSIPGALEAKPLAASLALAYMTSACQAPAELELAPVPRGAHAAFSATYRRRGDDDHAMEHVTVIVRRGEAAVDALYQVTRFRRGELSPMEWANVRTAIASSQDWTDQPYGTLDVWPASEFAEPGVVIKLLPSAWKEAQAKAATA